MSGFSPKVDVALLALYGRKGRGKTTLAVFLGILYARTGVSAPIYSNIHLRIPGVETIQVSKVSQLISQCPGDPCVCPPRIIIADEFDKSFTSRIGWVEKEHEQKLVELVSNIRKHNTIAFIATSQLKKKIKNDYRHNCDYIVEPTGTLDAAGCPEYFIWDDVELYEESGKKRYEHAEFCAAELPLDFLNKTFNTREIVPLEWD